MNKLGFSRVELPIGVDQCVSPLAPDAHHLGGLLFQGHSGKQIFRSPAGSAGLRYAGAGVFLMETLVAEGMIWASPWALRRIDSDIKL
jgi:hypothetical protein